MSSLFCFSLSHCDHGQSAHSTLATYDVPRSTVTTSSMGCAHASGAGSGHVLQEGGRPAPAPVTPRPQTTAAKLVATGRPVKRMVELPAWVESAQVATGEWCCSLHVEPPALRRLSRMAQPCNSLGFVIAIRSSENIHSGPMCRSDTNSTDSVSSPLRTRNHLAGAVPRIVLLPSPKLSLARRSSELCPAQSSLVPKQGSSLV